MLKTRIENRYWLAATCIASMRASARNACRLAIMVACWAGLQSAAYAGTINVTSTAQHSGATSHDCTLGAAILAANANDQVDGCVIVGTPTMPYTINIPAGTYTLSSVDGGSFGLPPVRSKVTLQGTGAAQTIIERSSAQGTPDFGLLSIESGVSIVTINGVTFQNGKNDTRGGAIAVQSGQLAVSDSVFQFNSSAADGGAISGADGGTISILNSTFTSNSAATQGGGVVGVVTVSSSTFTSNTAATGGAIACSGTVTSVITDSDFSQNTATSQGGAVRGASVKILRSSFVSNASPAGDGGALCALGGTASNNIIADSYFASNTADGKGGAMFCEGCTLTGSTFESNNSTQGGAFWGGGALLTNDTFHGNSAGTGGAIYSDGDSGFDNLTIVQNSSSHGPGGGIAVAGDSIQNSIVALNTSAASDPDCTVLTPPNPFSPPISRGHNLIGVDCHLGATTGDQFGTAASPINPVLGSLAPNNGLKVGRNAQVDVPTMALLVGSPALDAGDLGVPGSGGPGGTTCGATDQRGVARPVGSACDIGAFEAKVGGETLPFDVSVTSTPSAAQVAVGSALSYAISVDNHLSSNTATGLAVTFDISPSKFLQITPATGWSCTTPAVGASGMMTCTKASLPAQQSDTISVSVQAPFTAGDLFNSVTLATTGDDTDLSNNQSTTHVTVLSQDADLALTMSASPASVQVGNNITYTATVTNQGPGTATGVEIFAAIPGQATFVSAQVTSPVLAPCNVVANVLHCPVGSLSPKAAGSISVVLSPMASAVPALTFQVNTAANESDPTTGNNLAPVTTTVTPLVTDFSFSISPGNVTVPQGGIARYALTLTPSGGFTGAVQLTCTGAPAGSSCGWAPNPVMINNDNPVQANLTIQTTAPPSQAGFSAPGSGPWNVPGAWLVAVLLGFVALLISHFVSGSTRLRMRAICCASFASVLLLFCVGCGGYSKPIANNGTPKGSYTITVTASSGQKSHSSSITVVVGP